MRLEEGAIPAPAEALFLAVRPSPQQQHAQALVVVAEIGCWNAERTQLGFQQAQGLIRLDSLNDRDLPVVH